jgi:hypothetical protein
MAVAYDIAPGPSVADVARESLEDAGGDVIRATDAMVAVVQKDQRLFRDLMSPLVKSACYAAVRSQCRAQRRTIWHAAQPSADSERAKVVALAGGIAATYYDFPLPGGVRLGDAMREEVKDAAGFFAKQSEDMGHKARWLQMIARATPADKRVRDALTLKKIESMKQKAESH